jgi:hypothetical protein
MRRIALLALLGACTTLIDQPLPTGAEPFVPPAVYQQWWELTEACSGVSASMSAVSWYHVPGAETIPLEDGTAVNGRFDPVNNRIVLAGNAELEGDLVRHEMLHALIRSPGHPRAAFIGRCGGVVVCTKACITDAAPAPQPDPMARAVSPAAIQVALQVTPATPGAAVNGGNFMMTVTARNPSATPVIVQLQPSGDAGPSVSFSYRIRGKSRETWYDMRAEVPEDSWFAAGEVKQFIFDFHIGFGTTRYDLPPGNYTFGGAYGGVWVDSPSLLVSP